MNKKMRWKLIRIIITFILLIIAFIIKYYTYSYYFACSIAYIIIGYDIVKKAIKNIIRGNMFDENFLMTVATIGAFGIGEITESVSVMLFYQIGELFQNYAVDKSRKSISKLMDIRPDYANVCRDDIIRTSPDEVKVGDIILINPGEKVPLDGIIIEGTSMLNTLAITGESIPRSVKVGEEIVSGCINIESPLKVQVNKEFEESTVSKILELVENASSRKAHTEKFISKFARYYTPTVVVIAIILALIPPLIIKEELFITWLYRALSFLVVSCPCALVISIPLSFFAGIGALSKRGILVKGSNYIEALSNTEIIACDKTGTLTEGVFKVESINAIGISKTDLLMYVAHAESNSNHPISLSLKKAYKKTIDNSKVSQVKELSGRGIIANVNGKKVLVGNELLMQEHKIKYSKCSNKGTILYVAINDKYSGTIVIADKIKDDSYKAIKLFKEQNIKKIIMLTGDLDEIGKHVAKNLKIDEYHTKLLPQDKVSLVEKLVKETSPKGKLVFMGDGINDAPVLALADVGVAMGGLGSDAAIEAADVVIMNDEPSRLAELITLSKKIMHIVKQNIIFAITIKIGVLILSAIGLASMWLAVFADVGVSFLAILNSLRILYLKNTKE